MKLTDLELFQVRGIDEPLAFRGERAGNRLLNGVLHTVADGPFMQPAGTVMDGVGFFEGPGDPWGAEGIATLVHGNWINRNWKNETSNANAGIRKKMCDMLAEADGPILEVAAGPGGGNLPPILHRNSEAHLIANDISIRVLRLWNDFLPSQGEFPNVCFAAFDARRMPLRDASVSAVSSSGGFSNIHNAEKAISEAYRVLKSGGKLYIEELLVDPLDWAKLPEDYRKNKESGTSSLLPYADLLKSAGFNIIEHNASPNIRALEPEESGLAKETAPFGVTLHVRLEDIIAEKA